MRRIATGLVWILQAATLLSAIVLVYAVSRGDAGLSNQAYVAVVVAAGASVASMLLARHGGLAEYLHRGLFQNAWTTTLQHLVFLRFHLLLGAVLAASPWLALTVLSKFARNLYVVTLLDLFFISWLATAAAWSLMACTVLTVRYGRLRFNVAGMKMQPWLRRTADRGRLAIFALLAVPQYATAWWMLPASERWMGLLSIACGVGAAWSGLCLATILREWLAPTSVTPSMHMPRDDPDRTAQVRRRRFPWKLMWLHRTLGDGYFDPETQQPWAGHLHATALFLVSTMIYLLFGSMFAPNSSLHEFFPSLAYVLLVLILAVWGLPGVSFFLDRWRLPTLLPILAITLLLHTLTPTPNVYLILGGSAAAPNSDAAETPGPSPPRLPATGSGGDETPSREPAAPLDAATAYEQWASARGQENRAVVVLATGGGITAAAWTTTVLTGLERQFGEDFTNALTVVSSVSGGSVGAMYYLDDYQAGAQREETALERIRQAASANSLRATAWGIAYSDLWRFLAPTLARILPEDRGWAMQANWAARMEHGGATLRDWAKRVSEGTQPVSIMSATTVETGEPYLFAPVRLSQGARPRVHSFFRDFPANDIPIATAARLSATFPWVSPIATAAVSRWGSPDLRTAAEERPYHLADGAYYDNYGVVGADHWLSDVLRRRSRRDLPPLRVLVIRINAWDADADQPPAAEELSPEESGQPPEAPAEIADEVLPLDEHPLHRPVTEMPRDDWLRASGWVHATFGPIKTMLNVRLSSQMAQDKRLREYWEERVELIDASFNLRVRAPMSWQLPPQVVEQIRQAWLNELKAPDPESPVHRVRRFLDQDADGPRSHSP